MLQDIFATIGLFTVIWWIAKVVDANVTLFNDRHDCSGCAECIDWPEFP